MAPDPGQATAWLQAAAWLRMGPMGPRGLGPWALWAPGALGPTPFRLCRRCPTGFFFFGKIGVPKAKCVFIKKMTFVCRFLLCWPMLT